MTGAVHLVLVHVVPALVQADEGVIGIDVAVRLLGRGEFVDPLVAFGLQLRIGVVLEGVGHPFEGLVHVGIVEEDARVLTLALGGVLEVADAPRLVLDLVDADLQGDVLVALEPRAPERVIDADFGEVDGGDQLRPGVFPAFAGDQ